ncbi:MAG: GerMN domain-containing protein [Clostridium sp.]|nr:GerMN domain-containing protein [Clostridium sp.]
MKKGFNVLIVIVLIGIGFILGAFFFKSKEIKLDKASTISKEKLENVKEATNEASTDIAVYFGSKEDNAEIVKEERLVSNEELVGEIIMQELIKGPTVGSESKAVLPKETRLLNFSINEGVAYINLSNEAVFEMTQVQEERLLKSITSSMSQLVSVEKVMITVNNEGIETLGGNFNISKPFNANDISSIKIQK